VPEDVGRKVALGELSPEYVRDKYLKPRLVEEGDEMYKQLYEQERKKREELEKQLVNIQKELQEKVEHARQEAYRDAMQKLEELKRQWDIEEYQKTIMMLKDEKAALEAELKKLEPLKALREAFIKAFGVLTAPGSEPGQLEVEHKGLVVKVHHAGDKVVKVSTDSVVGQILYCAVKYFRDREFATGELNDKLLEHGWNVKPSTLSAKLSLLVNEGKLVKTDRGYRLPKCVKFEVEE
jgi:glutamate synthase domain-containing protein 2